MKRRFFFLAVLVFGLLGGLFFAVVTVNRPPNPTAENRSESSESTQSKGAFGIVSPSANNSTDPQRRPTPSGAATSLTAVTTPAVQPVRSIAKGSLEKEPFFDKRLSRDVLVVKGEVMVRFKKGADEDEITRMVEEMGAIVLQKKEQLGVYRLRILPDESVADFVEQHGTNANLALAEPNFILTTMGSITPNDPLYPEQWALAKIGADKAWTVTTGSTDVVVAILDTGIELTHNDLKNKIVSGYDFVNDASDPSDDNGHGTHVAGIVAAEGNNSIGVVGVTWGCRVRPLKVINADGEGTYSDVVDGLLYAADKGVRVINLSIGGYAYSQILADAVDYAHTKGAVLVAAAGNDGNSGPIYPAAYPNVIAVSATDSSDEIWPSSNYGNYIRISAPGAGIVSATLNDKYATASGTSASAAYVAGVASLILTRNRDFSNTQVEQILYRTAEDLGQRGFDQVFGFGRLDAARSSEIAGLELHDLAVTQIKVITPDVQPGEPAKIVITVQNKGTFTETGFAVRGSINDFELSNKSQVIAEIKPGQTVDLSFSWVPDRRQQDLVIRGAVTVVPEDINRRNNTKLRYYSITEENGFLRIQYKQEVHQWIGEEAFYKFPASSPFRTELTTGNNLGTRRTYQTCSGADSGTQILEGAWEEDDGWIVINGCLGRENRFESHFWNPDAGYNSVLPHDLDGVANRSALQVAQDLWQQAISTYSSDKARAYWLLGRVSHLLMDVSVPAHVHLDQHGLGDDEYEEYTGVNFASVNRNHVNAAIPSISALPSYPSFTPSSYDSDLTTLMYNMAKKAREFDSDDYNGTSTTYGNGKFRSARNALQAGKTVSSVEYWNSSFCIATTKRRDMTRYIDYDIVQNGCEFRIYYYGSFYDDINNRDRVVRVFYTDASSDTFCNLDEANGDVWDEPLRCVYEPELEARAIGYTAALYQLFWNRTHPLPTSPTGASATDGAFTSKVQVTWDSVNAATSYEVWRNTSNNSGSATKISSPDPAGTNFDDTGAAPGTRYYYWVKAKNANGTSDFSGSDPGYRALSAPTGVSATDGDFTDKVRITWTASTGATSYEVWRNTSNNSGLATKVSNPDPEVSPYDDTGASAGTTYWYWVKAKTSLTTSSFSGSDSGNRAIQPPPTRTLTVASSNPNSGVSVTVSPSDNNGNGSDITQFTRAYNHNTSVTLTAPATAGGNNFQKWLRGGEDWDTTHSTGVTMDANYTVTAVYVTSTQTVAKPVITPGSGTYPGPVPVSIDCATTDATIRYTTNGTDPTTGSTIYSGPFTLTTSATIKARGFKSGLNDSDVASATFTIQTSTNGGGTVNFANFAGPGGSTVNAPVFDVDGVTRLSGTAYLAQLYAGPNTNSLQRVGASVSFFTGAGAGYFYGGERVIDTVAPGSVAFIQIRVWESAKGSTYEEAAAAGGKTGLSNIFPVTTGGLGIPPTPPTDLVGLQSFSLTAPMQRYTLTMAGSPSGTGFIRPSPLPDNDGKYAAGTMVELTAEPAPPPPVSTEPSYYFAFWSGDLSGTNNPASVLMDTNKSVSANFTTQYYLTMNAGPGGTVSPRSGWYDSGAVVPINAIANSDYTFSSWTGSGSGSYSGTNSSASVTMNGPITETASFTANPVNISVTVLANPTGRSFTVDGTNYTTTQTFIWVSGSSHTIATISPQSGSTGVQHVWNSWSDGGAISHTVAPTSGAAYTANFTTQYYLTMNAGPGGTVSPNSEWFDSGAVVTMSAIANSDYTFSSWMGSGSGSYSGSNSSALVTMNGPITETANFTITPTPTTQLTGMTLSDGVFSFVLNGLAGSIYVIQVSSNLTDWSSLSTNTIPVGGSLMITDPSMVDQSQRFYRAVPYIPAGMVHIPAGSFQMGDSFMEGASGELPLHSIHLSPFFIDRFEVTRKQWIDVYAWALGKGYQFENFGLLADVSHPIQGINWYDAAKWSNARSEKEGLTPCYYIDSSQASVYRNGQFDLTNTCVKWGANGYRLPTEAEWEKAARGGLVGKRFPWGDTITHSNANYYSDATLTYDVSMTRGYHPDYSAAFPYSSPVGSFTPNGYGLFDAAGNAPEWCWDWYDYDWYAQAGAIADNSRGPDIVLIYRARRGGSWISRASQGIRCAYRGDNDLPTSTSNNGFRCVRGYNF